MIRKDGIDSVFMERELTKVLSGAYDHVYPELKGRRLVKTNRELQPGDKSFVWREYDRAGVVKLIGSGANDLPRADVSAKENTGKVHYYGASYAYDILEMLAAQRAAKPLSAMKGYAARMAHEENFDELIAVGNSKTGAVGLLNQPNFQTYSPPNGASTHADWDRKTPLEILADMNAMINNVRSSTKGAFKPTRLILPIAQFTLISTTPMFATGGSDVTILAFFLKNQPGVTVEDWYRCAGAGAASTDRMVAYDDSENRIAFFVAQEFTQLPVQEVGIEFQIPCMSGGGGVVAFYPLAGIYGDGI